MKAAAGGNGLLFVGGMARSGTSLLQRSLILHPDICGEREFQKLPDIVQLRETLHRAVDKGKTDYFGSKSDFDAELARLIENIFSAVREREKARVFSEKTPWNVLIFDELIELLPNARYIFVLRDPRAIAASLMQVGRKHRERGLQTHAFTTSLTQAIRKTRECFEKGFEAASKHPDHILTVRYEDFVADPESESRRICDFLDLPWSDTMLDIASHSDEIGEKLTGNWNDKSKLLGDIDQESVEKWRQTLTPVQQYLVTEAFRDMGELRDAGYNIDSIRLGFLHGLQALFVKSALGIRKVISASLAGLRGLLKNNRFVRKLYYAVVK